MTPEQQKEWRRDYYRRNKEKIAAYNRKYKQEHRKETSDYQKKYMILHPPTPEQEERKKEYQREYHKKPPRIFQRQGAGIPPEAEGGEKQCGAYLMRRGSEKPKITVTRSAVT